MSKMGLNAVSQHDNYWLYCTADLFTLKMSFHCSLLNAKVDEQSSLIFSIYLDVYDTKPTRQLLYQFLNRFRSEHSLRSSTPKAPDQICTTTDMRL